MTISTPEELEHLKAAGRVVRLALDAMENAVRPDISTGDLNAICFDVLKEHGARSAPPLVYNYPGGVCISVNKEVLHGIPSVKRILKHGDIVKLDLVAELDGWFADAAVTVMVTDAALPLKGNHEQGGKLIECAKVAFENALKVVKPGISVCDIGREVEKTAKKYGFNVLNDFGGHGIGRTIHEQPQVPNANVPALQGFLLPEGSVFTIEPIIVATKGKHLKLPDGWTIVTQDGGRSAHYEHTIALMKDGPVLITA